MLPDLKINKTFRSFGKSISGHNIIHTDTYWHNSRSMYGGEAVIPSKSEHKTEINKKGTLKYIKLRIPENYPQYLAKKLCLLSEKEISLWDEEEQKIISTFKLMRTFDDKQLEWLLYDVPTNSILIYEKWNDRTLVFDLDKLIMFMSRNKEEKKIR